MHEADALHRLEVAVLDLFVAGDEPALATLREQLAESHVARRERTEVGFFTFLEVPPHAHDRELAIRDPSRRAARATRARTSAGGRCATW